MWVPGIVKRNETAWHLVWRKAEVGYVVLWGFTRGALLMNQKVRG